MAAPIKIFNTTPAVYGKDYDRGWIGFNHADSWFASSIAHIERWKRKSDIIISHVFVCSGDDECVEAAYPKGVVRTKLHDEYWSRPDRYVIFRKPKNLTPELADRIVATAEAELGADFDFNTTANLALQKNFLGWIVNMLTQEAANRAADRLIEDDNRWLCSALAAYCLREQSEYNGVGILQYRPGMITPQELFEDDELFEPVARIDGSEEPVVSEDD